MRALLAALVPLLASCVTEIGPIDDTQECGVVVEETFPAEGATDAFYRGHVEFRLSEPDPTAVVLSDVPGVQWTRDEGRVVVFEPWDALTPDTAYGFGLRYCGGEPNVAFATSEVGLPMQVAPADLAATAWWLDLSSGRYLRGEALAGLVATVFHDGLWVGIEQVEGGAMTLLVAPPTPSGDHQDYCLATVALDKGSLVWAPWFEFSLADVDAWLGEEPLPLSRVGVSGAFDPTATRIEGIAWRFVVDLRDLATALGGKDVAALCDLASFSGAPCEPCADQAPTCVVLEGDSFTARYVPDVTIDRIEAPMSDPRCDR